MLPLSIAGLLFAGLSSAQTGPYTIRYYQGSNFGGSFCSTQVRSLRCSDIPAFECCEAPPGRSSFLFAKVFSSGPPGIVAFHSTDYYGGCLGCTTGGSINTCYDNFDPFEPASVLPVSRNICRTYYNENPFKSKRAMAAEKLPVIEGTGGEASVPRVCNKINAMSIQGVEYYLTTDLHDEFMHDFHNMADDEIIKKYSLVKTGAIDEPDKPQTPEVKLSAKSDDASRAV